MDGVFEHFHFAQFVSFLEHLLTRFFFVLLSSYYIIVIVYHQNIRGVSTWNCLMDFFPASRSACWTIHKPNSFFPKKTKRSFRSRSKMRLRQLSVKKTSRPPSVYGCTIARSCSAFPTRGWNIWKKASPTSVR